MSSVSHEPIASATEKGQWSVRLLVAETWASVAIAAMWVAVAVTAVWGPDFVSNSGPGGSTTTIPSGIAVAFFASIGTWAVAKYGLARGNGD
jgi:hypothetical protein